MKCYFIVLCVVGVLFFICVDGKRGGYSSRSKPKSRPNSNGNARHRTPPPPQAPPPPPKKTDVNSFLDAERQPSQNNRYSNTGFGNQQNPPPIGFDNVNRGTNNKPIGFEGFNNKPEPGKIGFDGINSGNKPSAPVLPGNNYGQSNPNFGQQNPSNNFGQSYPGQKNPSQNFGQPYPNQQNPNFGQSYPNQHSNFGQAYPNQHPNPYAGGQPNMGHSYPSNQNPYQQGFGQNYPSNPNNFGQSYPGQNYHYGNSYQGQPNFGYNQGNQGFGGFGSQFGGNNYGPHGGGGLSSGGFFGSNNGFNSYGNGYNNYGKRSRFGFGGMPLPIPIPIPIPFGGFGGYGNNYNSHRSHNALNRVVQQASNDSNNATSVYIINNSTVLPCTREHFTYDSYNISIVTCTVLNCTAVSVKTFKGKNDNGNIETNYGSVTMCLDPTATITTNSSGSNLPRLSDVRTYWKTICEHMNATDFNNTQILSGNSTNVGNLTDIANTFKTEINATVTKEIENTKTEAETESTTYKPSITNENITNSNITENANTFKTEINATVTKETENTKTEAVTESTTYKPNITNENITNSNLTIPTNVTEKPCEILNCSTVELCMPKVEIRCNDPTGGSCNYSVNSYISCVEIKMCSSQNSLVIDREVKLNTRKDIIEKDNALSNQTLKENVTVIAYIPPSPLVSQNTTFVNGMNTTCMPPYNQNMTGFDPSNPCGYPPSPSSSPLGVEIPTSTVSSL